MKVFSDRIITVNKNIEKSNRAKADLFELLITQGLINYFRLQINYLKQVTDLKTNLMNFPDGDKRINEQERKAKNLLPNIIKLLKRKVKSQGEIVGVIWIGRNFVKTQSLADIKIDFNDKSSLGISLKSVWVGTGTQKYDKQAELLTIVASKNNIISYSNEKYAPFVSGEVNIRAKKVKDKSYCILINDNPILRLQSSFTNGVGLSAFCQRAFLDKI